MERGFNAGQTHSSIYTHLSSTVYEILAGNCNVFLYPIVGLFNALVGVIPLELDDLRDFWWVSCRMAMLQYGAKISPER